MKISKEEQAARRKKKKEAWQLEIDRLRIKQEAAIEKSYGPAREDPNRIVLSNILEKLRSTDFRAWYEATTGEPVGEFLDYLALTEAQYRERYPEPPIGKQTKLMEQLDWMQARIADIARRNRWTDPEQRALWAVEVQNEKNPRRRRGILMQLATPRWANRKKILEIYIERERLTLETGIAHDVDHIVPIVHPLVCGLHCEFNLRVVEATENRKKSNYFDFS